MLVSTLEALLAAAAWLLALPVAVFVAEVLCSGRARVRKQPATGSVRPPAVVLMPAHNEELVIADTLRRLRAQLQPDDRVLVVADNCSDQTATLARQHGAQVVERFNTSLRGKGYALDHGVRHLEAQPPQWVVIFDADCTMHPGTMDALWASIKAQGRPAQAVYLMDHDPANKAVSPVAVFAWRVRNLVRPMGLQNLGGPCHLTGSGMAFPWPLLRDLPLASGHIVEDMKMGVDLAMAGHPPALVPDALVTSTFPVSKVGAQVQRTRWEHGTLGMLINDVPRLLWAGLRGQGRGVLGLALDMTVPPLALLGVILVGLCTLNALWALVFGSHHALWVMLVQTLAFAVAVVFAWLKNGRDLLAPSQVPALLGYVAGKLPIYTQFLVKRQLDWVRSKRDAD